MLKLILVIINLFIIPILIGLFFTKFMKKEKNNLAYSIIIGYFFEFAVYQIMTIPCSFEKKSFSFLYYTCLGIFLTFCIISVILNFKEFKNIGKNFFKYIKALPVVISIIASFLVFFQCFIVFKYMHIDQDDSNFVAKATVTLQTDTLYVYDDDGGDFSEYKFPERRILSPFPIYTAAVAKSIGLHPMAVAHTVFPIIFTLLMYTIFYLIGMKIFKDNVKDSLIFVIFVYFIYMFGNFNVHTNFTFAWFRLWQGKAILGNIIIPGLILLYDSFIQGKTKVIYWLCIFLTMFASCLVSTMGFAMAPLVLVGLTLVYIFRSIVDIGFPIKKCNVRKSFIDCFKIGIKTLLCLIPNVTYALMYSMMKGIDIGDEFF